MDCRSGRETKNSRHVLHTCLDEDEMKLKTCPPYLEVEIELEDVVSINTLFYSLLKVNMF